MIVINSERGNSDGMFRFPLSVATDKNDLEMNVYDNE